MPADGYFTSRNFAEHAEKLGKKLDGVIDLGALLQLLRWHQVPQGGSTQGYLGADREVSTAAYLVAGRFTEWAVCALSA